MNRVVSIIGPTTTGKTDKALRLAQEALTNKKYAGVDIISVDSRQVYRGLSVLTGADVPAGFQLTTETEIDGIKSCFATQDKSICLFGVAMISPEDEWSVTHFRNFARKILFNSWCHRRLPILVGGTGLYHQHLFSDAKELSVKPNSQVRARAERMTVEQLQVWLQQLDEERFLQLNQSDRNNRRRLIRAIEISLAQAKQQKIIPTQMVEPEKLVWSKVDNQIIQLTAPLSVLETKIKTRVKQRFFGGAVGEVKALLELKLESASPALSTLGVPEITKYLDGQFSAQETINLWALHEFQYAKRQITWWKKLSSH